MNILLRINYDKTFKKGILVGICLIEAFILLTILQDFLEANFNASSFYFAESFIFSSFWWILFPLLYAQYALIQLKYSNKVAFKIIITTLPILLHLIAFPAIVWIMSHLFYYHTFRFQQTLQFALSEHLFKLLFFYTIPLYLYRYFNAKAQCRQIAIKAHTAVAEPVAEIGFVVSEGSKRLNIAIADINYFTASSPYISIHHKTKKYLYKETLKSISEKIGNREFVRIHKSTIVNIRQVHSYTSRLNGDYDLTMKNGIQLRVSRNYASVFKAIFQQSHHLETK